MLATDSQRMITRARTRQQEMDGAMYKQIKYRKWICDPLRYKRVNIWRSKLKQPAWNETAQHRHRQKTHSERENPIKQHDIRFALYNCN